MKKILVCSSILLLSTPNVSCKKNGPGGDTKLVVSLKHHGNIIKNTADYADTVFVKFKAIDLPGLEPKDYDTYFTGNPGEDVVNINGLRPGKYFFYGVGMDKSGPYRVRGGSAVEITHKERKSTLTIDLAVTE